MVVGGLDVLARTDDIGGANLRRLGHRAEERDFARGVAAGADADMADFARAIDDETLERRHADIGRHVPDRHVDFGVRQKIEHRERLRIVDRREIETSGSCSSRGL